MTLDKLYLHCNKHINTYTMIMSPLEKQSFFLSISISWISWCLRFQHSFRGDLYFFFVNSYLSSRFYFRDFVSWNRLSYPTRQHRWERAAKSVVGPKCTKKWREWREETINDQYQSILWFLKFAWHLFLNFDLLYHFPILLKFRGRNFC